MIHERWHINDDDYTWRDNRMGWPKCGNNKKEWIQLCENFLMIMTSKLLDYLLPSEIPPSWQTALGAKI